MGVFEHFPYTNFHDINLDRILERTKEAEDAIAQTQAALDAAVSDMQSASSDAAAALNAAGNAVSTAQTAANDAATAISNASSALTTANAAMPAIYLMDVDTVNHTFTYHLPVVPAELRQRIKDGTAIFAFPGAALGSDRQYILSRPNYSLNGLNQVSYIDGVIFVCNYANGRENVLPIVYYSDADNGGDYISGKYQECNLIS